MGSNPEAAGLYGLRVPGASSLPSWPAARWPAWPGSSTPPATAPVTPTSAPATSCRRGRRGGRRGGDRRRLGTRLGRRAGRLPPATISRALPVLGIEPFWQRAVVGVLIIGAIGSTASLAAPTSRAASARHGRSHDDRHRIGDRRAPRTYRTHAQPAWRRVLLARESAAIALLLIVIAVSLSGRADFDSPLTFTLPAARRGADPADRPADDAHRHHREIDLSVASVARADSSVMAGSWPRPVAARCRRVTPSACCGRSPGAINGLLITVVGAALAGGDHRHARAVRGIGRGSWAPPRSPTSPSPWTTSAKTPSPARRSRGDPGPFVVARDRVRSVLHVTPVGRSASTRSGSTRRPPVRGRRRAAHEVLLFVISGAVGRAGVYFTLRFATPAATTAPASSSP